MTVMTDEREPLLAATSLEASDSRDEKPAVSPIPWGPISILLLLNALGPLAYELIFPFINQMLVELKIVTNPESVGFYSGIIESAFSLMSLITILPMSYASDRMGRKPVILLGMGGLAVSLVGFGMSRTYFWLIVSRCLGGALGGVWAAVKIMVGELTDRTNQSVVFNALTLTYRLGQMFGLPLGGFLAHPERHFPAFFDTPFWLHYPFLLPCLVGAGFAILGVTLGAIFLQETAARKRRSPPASPRTKVARGLPVLGAATTEAENIENDLADSKQQSQDIFDDEEAPSIMELLRNSQVSALIVSNFGMCTTSELLFNVYPLFAYTPIASGGLGFTEAQIGMHLSARAMIHLVAIALFNPFYRWLGRTSCVRVYQCSMMLWPFISCFYPLLNLIARSSGTESWLFYSACAVFFFVWSFAGYCWTCIGMLATDASPSAAALSGINGIIQMSLTLPQVITPAFSNSFFAYSIEHDDILGGQLVWAVFFIIACASAMHSLFLKEATDDWRANAAHTRKSSQDELSSHM